MIRSVMKIHFRVGDVEAVGDGTTVVAGEGFIGEGEAVASGEARRSSFRF